MGEIAWFYDIEEANQGGWDSSVLALASLVRAGLPVLPGFALSAQAVQRLFLQPKLKQAVERAYVEFTALDGKVPASQYALLSKQLMALLAKHAIDEQKSDLEPFLHTLRQNLLLDQTEGLPLTLTWTGLDWPLSVSGAVKSMPDFARLLTELLSQLFLPHQLQHRVEELGLIMPKPTSILVQYQGTVEASGFGQCFDPHQHDGEVVYLEAHLHHHPTKGKALEAEVYRFDKATLHPLSASAMKSKFTWAKSGPVRRTHDRAQEGGLLVLTLEEQARLARLIKRANAMPGLDECKFTWCYTHHQLQFTGIDQSVAQTAGTNPSVLPVLSGISGNLGVAVGPVRELKTASDFARIQPGEIVVVNQLEAKLMPELLNVAGIICQKGHAASIESKLAMQLMVPAVVGVRQALGALKDGVIVTIDGTQGAVYLGKLTASSSMELRIGRSNSLAPVTVTGTRLSVYLDDPLEVSASTLQPADGVGLIRGEYLLHLIGHSPAQIMERHRQADFGFILEELLERAARAVYPRAVRYQFHDYGHRLDLESSTKGFNCSLGFRGAHRLLHEPELLKLELKAVANLYAKGLDNLELVVPMVRQIEEFEQIAIWLQQDWPAQINMPKVWIRTETPGLLIEAEEVAKLPIAGVMIDIVGVAQLIMGFDARNAQVAHHLVQASSPVLEAIRYAVGALRGSGKEVILISENQDLDPEVVEVALQAGLTELCVHLADLDSFKQLVATLEQRLLLDHLLRSSFEG